MPRPVLKPSILGGGGQHYSDQQHRQAQAAADYAAGLVRLRRHHAHMVYEAAAPLRAVQSSIAQARMEAYLDAQELLSTYEHDDDD